MSIAVWARMTAGEAGDWLAAADVLAVQWWLKERQSVDASLLVKTVVVCRYASSSSLTVDSTKSKRVLICCVNFLFLWQRRLN